ncbi:site-2 protease family protein [Saccharomonospora sp. NPDC006951]
MVAYAWGVALFLVGACASIALHEAGHLLAAKAFGMKVRRYFVGYGPTAFSVNRGGAEYGLKWLPFGGFCDIAGMTTSDELKPGESPRAMWRFAAWKRTAVMGSGVVVNFALGFLVLYFMAVSTGLPNIAGTPEVSTVAECVTDARTPEQAANPVCGPGDPAPAKSAGIEVGDEIVSVAGQPIGTYSEAIAVIRRASGPTPVEIRRDGSVRQVSVDVVTVDRPLQQEGRTTVAGAGSIGVNFPLSYDYTPITAVAGAAGFTGDMFVRTWERLVELPQRIPAVVEAIFGGDRDPETPVSVVGMSRIGGEAVQHGLWELFLLLLAGLNFFLGAFNMLPLLPMDGGHIAIIWYERVRDLIRRMRGRAASGPVDYTRLSAVTAVIVLAGGIVMLLTIVADIVNPIRVI